MEDISPNLQNISMKNIKEVKKIVANDPTPSINMENYCLFIRTVQAGAIRTLSEALKEVLTDVNIHFNDKGAKIMSMDGSKVALVHLQLEGPKFEEYYCRDTLQIGVNMLSLFKLLKTIGNTDIVTLYIEKNDLHKLGIRIENKEKSIISNSKLKLLDLDETQISIPDVVFDSVITMPCVDFQKYCRDLATISNTVTISSKGNIFSMYAHGDFAEQEITIGETSTGLVISKKEVPVSGDFPLKYLNLFCKSSGLCSNIEIYLKDMYPLILVFSISSLGTIKFGLAPRLGEEDLN
jgi:proliferating cell nuclear antigen